MAELDPGADVASWIDRVSFTKIPPAFHFRSSPYRVPARLNRSETINKILTQSLVVQSSRIPKSKHPNLPHFIFSNGCIIISELLRYYLSYLQIDAKVRCGTMIKGRGRGMVHVFLEIEKEIVDNAYIHIALVCMRLKLWSSFSMTGAF